MFSSNCGDTIDADGEIATPNSSAAQTENVHQSPTSVSPNLNDPDLHATVDPEASVEFRTKSTEAASDLINLIRLKAKIDVVSTAIVNNPQHRNVKFQKKSIGNEECYFMNQSNRGCFIIFNQENFDLYNAGQLHADHICPKKGSIYDAKLLGETAEKLGFENILIVTNAMKWQILTIIKLLSSKFDHSDKDCFCCAILTHAGKGDVLYARDADLHLTDFTKSFKADNCPSLAEKPKLFIIQAAVKEESSCGANATVPDGTDGPVDQPTGDKEFTIPTEADFLIVRSTVPDSSWRSSSHGSYFIEILCTFLDNRGETLELVEILTRVNNDVAKKFRDSSSSQHIPEIVTRLTAAVYFPLNQELLCEDTSSVTSRLCNPPPSHFRKDTGHKVENEESNTDESKESSQSSSEAFLQQHHVEEVPQSQNERFDQECRYNIKRGKFIIFNQETFVTYNNGLPEAKHLGRRTGTNKDASNLEEAFQKLGFEVLPIVQNATHSEIRKKLEMLSKLDHSDYGCFGCAILTHGGHGDVLYAEDRPMHLKDLTNLFCAADCSSLAGKPKLFFIQACRGGSFDHGVIIKKQTVSDSPDCLVQRDGICDSLRPTITIPIERDFLIANSTAADYYSWRDAGNGSYFIQNLCFVLNKHGKTTELMKMLTQVNKKVALEFESASSNAESNKKKQMPSIASRLTLQVYFNNLHQQQVEGKEEPIKVKQVEEAYTTRKPKIACGVFPSTSEPQENKKEAQ